MVKLFQLIVNFLKVGLREVGLRHMYWCNGVVVAVNATMLNSKSNSIFIRKIKLIQSHSQVHNHSMPICHIAMLVTKLSQYDTL